MLRLGAERLLGVVEEDLDQGVGLVTDLLVGPVERDCYSVTLLTVHDYHLSVTAASVQAHALILSQNPAKKSRSR